MSDEFDTDNDDQDNGGSTDLKPLRKAFKELPEVRARAENAEQRVAALERQLAVKDTPGLLRTPDNAKVFDLVAGSLPADADTPEKIQAHFAEFGLHEPVEDDTDALTEAKAAAAVARSHTEGRSATTKTLTPQAYNEFTVAEIRSFKARHPDAHEALKQGQTVSGIDF